MIIFVKDEDDVLVIPVGLGPNVGEQECPEPVMEDITLDSSTVEQTVTPGEGVDGFSGVTVNPYILDTKTVDSSTVSQTITSDEDGLSQVTVNPVTASIDSNIQPGNIKKNVSILGVTGTYDPGSTNWIVEAKKGNLADLSGYSLGGISSQEYGTYMLFRTSNVTSVPSFDTSVIGNYACGYMFYQSNVTSATIDGVENIGAQGCLYMFSGCPLTYLSMPDLTTVYSNTYSTKGIAMMLNSTTADNLRVELPKLSNIDQVFRTSSSGNQGFIAGSLERINLESLSNTLNWKITSIRVHANAFSLFMPCAKLTNVEITDGYIMPFAGGQNFVLYTGTLTKDSMYSIISHLDPNVDGQKYFRFRQPLINQTVYYSYTFTDWPDGRFQTAYDAAAAAGWSIPDITIIPYS